MHAFLNAGFSHSPWFFSRCKMTLGLGNVSVQSAFVSQAAAWKWQTSHGSKYILALTKLIIYLLLPRLKSLLSSFPLELGALLAFSLVRTRGWGSVYLNVEEPQKSRSVVSQYNYKSINLQGSQSLHLTLAVPQTSHCDDCWGREVHSDT